MPQKRGDEAADTRRTSSWMNWALLVSLLLYLAALMLDILGMLPLLRLILLGVGLLVSLIVLGLIVHRIKTWTD